MNTLLGSLIGQQAANAITSLSAQGQINQAFNAAYQQYGSQAGMNSQQQAAQAYNQLLGQNFAGLAKNQHKYMINGRTMHFDEFLEELCPDPEDPMRTLLILKYKGME